MRPGREVARRPAARQAGDTVLRPGYGLLECVGTRFLRDVMRSLVLVFVATGLIAAGGSAGAQTREDVLRCRSISDETRRLACYDAIELLGAPRSKYEILDLSELKGFALSYRGDLVEVVGWIRPGEQELLFLGTDQADPRPIPIDFQRLSRRDREDFLEACGGGCEGMVQGRVSPLNFTTGIVADTLTAR